jgi:hypothetical protein
MGGIIVSKEVLLCCFYLFKQTRANMVYYVEDPKSAWEFYLIVNRVEFPQRKEAREVFDRLTIEQMIPFDLLVEQDLLRFWREIAAKNEYFVPGTNWPWRYNCGAGNIFERCKSCFVLRGHLPECEIHGYEYEESECFKVCRVCWTQSFNIKNKQTIADGS